MIIEFKCPNCGEDLLVEKSLAYQFFYVFKIDEDANISSYKEITSEGVGGYDPVYLCDNCGQFIADGSEDLLEWLKEHNQLIEEKEDGS